MCNSSYGNIHISTGLRSIIMLVNSLFEQKPDNTIVTANMFHIRHNRYNQPFAYVCQ